ncbi:MAG: (Fe-S)-binding protein [Eggerthellaceae bacterium]
MSMQSAFSLISSAANTCNGCQACRPRCLVLEEGMTTVGEIAAAFAACAQGCDLATDQGSALCGAHVAALAHDRPALIFAVRRCCMCAFCTQECAAGVDARSLFAAVREVLALAGVTTTDGFESTQVDTEWHIFSVYRAVYGINYLDLPHLGAAPEQSGEEGAAAAGDAGNPAAAPDTLFFPGCPLASYAPELTREIFAWLQACGMNVVLSEACCGSPLKSAGLGDRARQFKQALARAITAAGITRVVCVCPGCLDELRETEGMDAVELVALPQLLVDAGCQVNPDKLRALAASAGVGQLPPAASSVSDDTAPLPTVAVCDSCHDRAGAFGNPLRELFDDACLRECEHNGSDALCCGAGGAVSLVDPALCTQRAQRVLDEGSAHADVVVANCPTCSYTFAAQGRSGLVDAAGSPYVHANYLDLMFEASFDWDTIFSQLEGMWSGEYGPWVCQQLT